MRTRWSTLAVLLALLGGHTIAQGAEAQDELFVANSLNNTITVYHRAAGGNVTPLRTLGGPATGLRAPVAVLVDLAHDELIVANQDNDSITVYVRTASGNTAPLRTLSGPATGLDGPSALVLDFTTLEGGPGVGTLYVGNSISVTAYLWPNAGNAAPLRTIAGAATGIDLPRGLVLDLTNDELVVANFGDASITVYSRTASGNTAPLRTLKGPATGLSGPRGLAFDLTTMAGGPGVGELYVTNQFDASVNVYLWPTGGNVPPTRTIKGAATRLFAPNGVALDLVHDELLVSVFDSIDKFNAVAVYRRTASGDTGPIRMLAGAGTGLSTNIGLAVATSALAVDRDFNGDGKSDILLQNTSGALDMWLMDGFQIVTHRVLGTVPAGWTVAAVGDFNGDHKADLLFRHTTGTVAILLMDGFTVLGSGPVGTIANGWTVERVGDFNGDVRADILWRHTSGAISIWLMNGAQILAAGSPLSLGPEWEIQ
jgi:hypothetical protein